MAKEEKGVAKKEENLPAVNPALAALSEAAEVKELTAEYLSAENFEEGVEERFIFTGKRKMKAMEAGKEDSDAVTLMNAEGKTYITALTVIVGSCIDLEPGTGVAITYIGKEKGKSKLTYDKFKVTELAVKLKM